MPDPFRTEPSPVTTTARDGPPDPVPVPVHDHDALAHALGQAVAMARGRSGLSQSAVARGAGFAPSQVSRVERGLRLLSMRQLFRISRLLGHPAAAIVADAERLLMVDPPPAASTTASPVASPWRVQAIDRHAEREGDDDAAAD